MKEWELLKQKCESSNRFTSLNESQMKIYKKEISVAKRFYKANRNLLDELIEKKDNIKTNYIIPYLLNLTDEFTNEKQEYIQVVPGASGGIDIDSDLSGEGREKIFEYLQKKYGEDRILYVGTSSSLGPKSAAGDLLRVYGKDYGKSVSFTKALDSTITWSENLERLKAEDIVNYQFYLSNKDVLDLVPKFIGKIRNSGKHAGGVVVTKKPIHNYVPVDRTNGFLATAFPESGGEPVLDELGIVKYDLLGVSTLDVIGNTIDMIDEQMYLIEDDDGIKKIVPESYLNTNIETF